MDFSTVPCGEKKVVFGSESDVFLRFSGQAEKASPQLKTLNSVLIQRLISARFGAGWIRWLVGGRFRKMHQPNTSILSNFAK